jgi:hypothetical protein
MLIRNKHLNGRKKYWGVLRRFKMINYLSYFVKKDFEINQIRMITTDYSYKELSKFKLWQLESIKSLIRVGFKKDYINEKRLYNFGKGAIKFIIELEMQNKRKNEKSQKKNYKEK